MATNDNPLHALESYDLDAAVPVSPWTKGFDGATIRNVKQNQLAERDRKILDQIQILSKFGATKVSPFYPFKSDATLTPSSIEILDSNGVEISDFTIDFTELQIPKRFIKDLKLILANEFSQPYVSRMTLVRRTDPITNLLRVFVDLEISARYSVDSQDYVIFRLESRAYNDNPTNEDPSTADNVSFPLEPQKINGVQFLNSGIIEFEFIGAVYSTTSSSWSFGVTDGGVQGDGFTLPLDMGTINYTFTREGGKLTLLSYNELADLSDSVPFLQKVKYFPFSPDSTVGDILSQHIIDLNMTSPAGEKVYVKRIRRRDSGGSTYYVFLFAYNVYDSGGNFLRTVNLGVAEIGPSSNNRAMIQSLGSNTIAGVEPSWLDEVPSDTTDSFGHGILKVDSYTTLDQLWTDLTAQSESIGSPSPVVVSPDEGTTVGVFADTDVLVFTDDASEIDGIALDTIGIPLSVFAREVSNSPTKNIQVTIEGEVINSRTVIGNENLLRSFYNIDVIESLVDNDKIPIGDFWFDESRGRLQQYLIVGGKRQWRAI